MAVADVEPYPADMLEMRLSPAVRRILTRPVVHHQIARDIARRMPQVTHRGDEDMRMVLAHAAGAGERLLNGRLGVGDPDPVGQLVEDQRRQRSEEHTSELQSLMRISYAAFSLKKKPIYLTTQH